MLFLPSFYFILSVIFRIYKHFKNSKEYGYRKRLITWLLYIKELRAEK
jgi:hypothetical protein